MEEYTEEQKEQAVVIISDILKSLASKKMVYVPWGSDGSEIEGLQKLAIESLHLAMNVVAEGMEMDEEFKHALIMYQEDLDRILQIPNNG